MEEDENHPTQPQYVEMYNRMVPTPNPNIPMHSSNNMSRMSSLPTFNQATQPQIPQR